MAYPFCSPCEHSLPLLYLAQTKSFLGLVLVLHSSVSIRTVLIHPSPGTREKVSYVVIAKRRGKE